MALIPFPDIPDYAGVPSIPRSIGSPATQKFTLGLLEGILWDVAQTRTRWGIFNSSGEPLGDPVNLSGLAGSALRSAGFKASQSVDSVEYSKETKVSDFPVELGSFASYNKIETPANPVVVLTFSGNESERRSFLEEIDKACKSTDLYSVVTPEVTYIEYSVERYSYQRRRASGATLLIVEISLKEIRSVSASFLQIETQQINDPKNADATPKADNGKVQAKEPKKSTALAVANKVTGLVKSISEGLSQ